MSLYCVKQQTRIISKPCSPIFRSTNLLDALVIHCLTIRLFTLEFYFSKTLFETYLLINLNLFFSFQLSVLQARMREALEYFYRLRGLQSKADIAEFELKCIENGGKLVTLQSDMMRVIEHINRFLEANNAAHDVISMEAAKIAQTPTSGTMVA